MEKVIEETTSIAITRETSYIPFTVPHIVFIKGIGTNKETI